MCGDEYLLFLLTRFSEKSLMLDQICSVWMSHAILFRSALDKVKNVWVGVVMLRLGISYA